MGEVSFGTLTAGAGRAGVFRPEGAYLQIDDNKYPRLQSVEEKLDMFVNQFAAS
jgi:hypothetical protein